MTPQNDAPWWDPDARATEETPQPTASPEPESQPENGSAPRRMSLRKTICDWISANRHTALYMLIGLVICRRHPLLWLLAHLARRPLRWRRLHPRQLARRAIRASWRASAIFMSA